ncbi:SDR family oxidoreductase [Flavobacterium ginsengisoli]|jgi:NAD(P)-dependent dehydrogenase (short-subunit alcohol dehydrogenase family)|nr:SDR family oxidoreductase [Flavobacterium ginsengisoli]
MGFLGEPSDIADAVYYFALSESKYTTGTVLPVDGGNSIGF